MHILSLHQILPGLQSEDSHPRFFLVQAYNLLSVLSLQEEFVKWKDCLFFRFVSVLVDPNPDIAR